MKVPGVQYFLLPMPSTSNIINSIHSVEEVIITPHLLKEKEDRLGNTALL